MSEENRSRGVLRTALAGLASIAIVCGLSAAPANAADWIPEYVDGVLQPLPDGFPNDPITLVNTDDAGSADGLYARTLQKILNEISPQRVNVMDRPSTSFGTWEALKFATEEPGGNAGHVAVVHTVPAAALDLLTVDMKAELDMDLDDLNVAITTEEVPYVLMSRTGAPWRESYEDFISYAKANPGKVRYLSREVGSASDITATWLFNEEGIKVEKIIGGSMQELGIAVASGEVDVALVFAEVALTHFQNKRAEVLLMTGDTAIAPWTDKPVMSSVVDSKDMLLGRVIGLAVPASVPAEHRAWLYEVVKKATEDKRYQDRGAALPGRVLRNRTNEDAMRLARSIFEIADPIVRDLGLHHEGAR